MRSGLLLPVLVLLLLTSAAHAQEVEPAWLEVANTTLNLRSGPSTDDDVITRLTAREAVELLQRGEAWSQVRRQDGETGWAHNDYLLPWDERNRPDTWRRVGEKRLFLVLDENAGRSLGANATLDAVSEHSYIYTYSHNGNDDLPNVQALQQLGQLFDDKVYQQSLDLWDIRDPPAINGDERVVILYVAGTRGASGWYTARHAMPRETNPNGTGFIGIRRSLTFPGQPVLDDVPTLAHEFRHMLHHHTDGIGEAWVNEGLAEFSRVHMELNQPEELAWATATAFLSHPRAQIAEFEHDPLFYGASMMLVSYIHERLGLQALREIALRPGKGLDALDAQLAAMDFGMDADAFIADWVLANYLLDQNREDDRFRYHLPGDPDLTPPSPRQTIRRFPVGLRGATPPYSADYYELPLPTDDAPGQLLLDFRLAAAPPQDAWLQLVQLFPDRIDVQRFRASDYHGNPVLASMAAGPERIFVAITPFTTSARQRTRPVDYSLALRQHAGAGQDKAQVTTTLRVRSEAEIADNVLGNLQRCSVVTVLERREDWSQVLNADGLTGWSHNDFLVQPGTAGASATAASCARLTRAAHDGDLSAVQRLLASGVSVDGTDPFGRTALHEAAMWGHDAILARLLRAGASVHAQDAAGRTALDEALQTGNVSGLLLLAEAGADLDLSGPASLPLMIEAGARGNTALLDLILAEGHDVNWQAPNGQTTLAVAAANGQAKTLQQLITAGADVHWRDDHGRSSLMLAAINGAVETLALLFDANVDVNLQDSDGHSALTLAAQRGNLHAVTWLLLLRDKLDLYASTQADGRNALHLAAAAGHDEIVAQLLLTDLAVTAQDAQGQDALHLASAAGHEDVAALLRVATMADQTEVADPTTGQLLTEQDAATFLAAARSGNLTEVERLIKAGIGLETKNEYGLTALLLAADAGNRDVLLRLLLAGATPNVRGKGFEYNKTPLYFTLKSGFIDLHAMLLVAGARPYAEGLQTALHWAAEFGRPDVARLLLSIRNLRQRLYADPRGVGMQTPLFAAIRTGRSEIVDLLLAAGADPNARDSNPSTALEWAVLWEREDIVGKLLDAGADPNAYASSRVAPDGIVSLARSFGRYDIARILLEAGAEA